MCAPAQGAATAYSWGVSVMASVLLWTGTEIRQEAVMQALAQHKKSSALPMPSKRTSALYANAQKKAAEQRPG